jgi:hypothetical protein
MLARGNASRRGVRAVVLGAIIALAVGGAPSSVAAPSGDVRIKVLSGRGDLVTGGDAYLRVTLPAGTPPQGLRVYDDGREVTEAFAVRGDGIDGVVKGLSEGENVVRAVLPNVRGDEITLTNHPIGGPVFSGPQIQPWTCKPGSEDRQCNRPTRYEYSYKSTLGGPLRPYDPQNPPPDVATTTTDQGKTVPFIVREEIGVTLRDEYRIAVLYDPSRPWDPTAPQSGYNQKLVLTHGQSCDTAYEMGSAPDVLLEDALSRGFAVASHALDNSGHNCNLVTEAESLVVTKELVAERYGPIRYTIGTGCSGGSLVQQQVANAYPGIYQGILPQCSYTDAWSSTQQYIDYTLLRSYFESAQNGPVPFTPSGMASAYGHPNPTNPVTFTEVIPNSGDPSRPCPGVPPEDVYSADNPDGVRCTLQDYMVNVFGTRPDGKARRPFDNTGIQYGLSGLADGTITPSQFVDLNAEIGGFDLDANSTQDRMRADPVALDRVYRSGAVNTAAHLDEVAIIDLRGPDPGAFHDVYRTYAMRERLIREHGTAANQVLWRGQVPLYGDKNFVTEGIRAMDRWLSVVEQDTSDRALSEKIIDARDEAGVSARCTDGIGHDIAAGVCDETVESYSTPRMQAGAPLAADTMKCRLVPLDRQSYDVTFTDADWQRLQEAFPHGVCDYSKPGVSTQDAVTWLQYDVYGGRSLGPEPQSAPIRRGRP